MRRTDGHKIHDNDEMFPTSGKIALKILTFDHFPLLNTFSSFSRYAKNLYNLFRDLHNIFTRYRLYFA